VALPALQYFNRGGGTCTGAGERREIIAVDGLRQYRFHGAADRLARKFVDLVAKKFDEHGVAVEKYDVIRRESDLRNGLRLGYTSNAVGFGRTNTAMLELLADLQPTPSRGR
jgi:alpha,alpha-trehalase